MRAKGTPQEPTIANNHVKSQIPAQSARAPPHIKAYWPYLKKHTLFPAGHRFHARKHRGGNF